ncbi:hypothetical protein C5C74_09475 [Rathayibacter sp. AY1E8]|uniref:hypothetical protein n=1 Tax=unclassified Rathayibacter TaxID=2609250 RepID=UPI000CE8C7F1|nr:MULTISPECIES: hypothetical protein [unclassified Rathayibacter]PPG17961.1 hypothetical protein C5C74_09475 [Rathayibacter sp. AY1E8]PPI01197.1 hypothetical protein C5C95_03410 [Rathayibacter sp. AY1B7]
MTEASPEPNARERERALAIIRADIAYESGAPEADIRVPDGLHERVREAVLDSMARKLSAGSIEDQPWLELSASSLGMRNTAAEDLVVYPVTDPSSGIEVDVMFRRGDWRFRLIAVPADGEWVLTVRWGDGSTTRSVVPETGRWRDVFIAAGRGNPLGIRVIDDRTL